MTGRWSPAGGGIAACARAVIAVFPEEHRQVMLAIPGAETTWKQEPGDPLSIYPDGGRAEEPYSCNGASSFGAWQINLPANHDLVAELSGIPARDPCGQARWLLESWDNAARAALDVFQRQGYGAWTTYRTGAYQAHMAAAQEALAEAQGAPLVPPPGPSPAGPVPFVPWQAPPVTMPALQPGDSGVAVMVLQRLLGVSPVDGQYGPQTEASVLAAKRTYGLEANAAVGAGLWQALAQKGP